MVPPVISSSKLIVNEAFLGWGDVPGVPNVSVGSGVLAILKVAALSAMVFFITVLI